MFYMFLTAFKAFVLVHLGAHSSPKVKKNKNSYYS